jgi:hypothetical protein
MFIQPAKRYIVLHTITMGKQSPATGHHFYGKVTFFSLAREEK